MLPPDDLYQIVRRIVSEVTEVPEAELHPETAFSDLNLDRQEFDAIHARACEARGVNLARLIETMPVHSPGAGPCTMSSLRNLAPFHRGAARLLARLDVPRHDGTLESLSETIRRREFVPSGRRLPPDHPPRSRGQVLGAVLLVALAWLVLAPMGSNPDLAGAVSSETWISARVAALPSAAAASLAVLAAALGPGLWALRSDRRRRAARFPRRTQA